MQTAKLTASDGAANDRFGISVAVSGDTVVVGAHGDDGYRGSAYVYVKPGGGWVNATQTAKLTASDRAADDYFGYSVAVSGDTVVVGAYGDDGSRGSAYVFNLIFTVSYVGNGSTGGSMSSQTHNLPTALTANAFTRSGYSFAGWSTTPSGSVVYADGATYNFSADITLYAQWNANDYTITFDSAGGSAVAPITQAYGSAVTAPADPTKTGYAFNGWNPAVPATMPLNGAALTAQWNANDYTITFDSAGGSAVAPITQAYGSAVTAPADPTKAGYTFAGWNPALPATMPLDGAALTAQWTANDYTITFDSAGGSAVAPITQAYGSAVTAPADPTKAGYTFAGWNPALPATMPLNGAALTAQWNANEYTITFDSAGGSAVAPITQAYGSSGDRPGGPDQSRLHLRRLESRPSGHHAPRWGRADRAVDGQRVHHHVRQRRRLGGGSDHPGLRQRGDRPGGPNQNRLCLQWLEPGCPGHHAPERRSPDRAVDGQRLHHHLRQRRRLGGGSDHPGLR